MNNENFQNLLNKSIFFNKNISSVKTNEIIINKTSEDKQKSKILDTLPKLNICSGPNVFPFPGWINYDREDISEYLKYLDWQDEAKTMAYVLHEMPEPQQKLANFIRSGNKVDFRVKDIELGFTNEHNDNSVGFIYIGQAIEHFSQDSATKLLNDCYRMLVPGGILRMTTPDLDLLIQAYLNNEMNKFASEQPDFYKTSDAATQLAMIMYGSSGKCSYNNYSGHMFLYNKVSMTKLLEKSGFKNIEFYYEAGKGGDKDLSNEVVDAGMTHSFITTAVK